MTLITPVGNNSFSWAPNKNGLTKSASTGEVDQTDKDALYQAASKFVKAQAEKAEKAESEAKESDESEKDEKSESEGSESKAPEFGSDKSEKPECEKSEKSEEASPDVQKAVAELVEKANKTEEIAAKVEEAVGKVEQAVQEVKDAAGVVSAEGVESAEISGESVPESMEGQEGLEGVDSVELEIEPEEVSVGIEDKGMPGLGDQGDDQLIKESLPSTDIMASANDFVKLSAISPETRNKIKTYWQDYLGFPSDYVKLMTKNYEK